MLAGKLYSTNAAVNQKLITSKVVMKTTLLLESSGRPIMSASGELIKEEEFNILRTGNKRDTAGYHFSEKETGFARAHENP